MIAYFRLPNKEDFEENTTYTFVNKLFMYSVGFFICDRPGEILKYYPGKSNWYAVVETRSEVFEHGLKKSVEKIHILKIMSYRKFLTFCTDTFEDWSGNKYTYVRGKLHSNGVEPAVTMKNGNLCWYYEDKLHREDGQPAIIKPNGEQYWYRHGSLHRENGPAVIRSYGEYWYQCGKPFRADNLPVFIKYD